ncbi:SGNH/GDSL hydrolase family protein [Candidatus Gottesmanbacteria bacterium]|nr:SGNH/GDSL hydrolase family protein [Candidatus Gottesmanbacteria bacterium]
MKNTPGSLPIKNTSRSLRATKIIAGLLFLEMILQTISFSRYVFWRVYEYKEKMGLMTNDWFYAKDSNKWWLTESEKIQAQYHPLLSFTPKPLNTPHITINDLGIRETTGNPATISHQQIKIFMFGGSTLFGTNVSDGETVPSHVAKLLNTKAPVHRITNFGVSAYNSSQELASLLIQLKQGNIPDMVVFYDGINELYSRYLYTYSPGNQTVYEDIIRTRLGNIYSFHVPYRNQSLLDFSYLSQAARSLASRIKVIDYPIKFFRILRTGNNEENNRLIKFHNTAALPDDVTRIYAENIAMVRNLSKIYGFKTLFIWQPSIATKKLTDDETEVINSKTESAGLYKEITKKVTELALPDFVDASGVFSNVDQPVYLDFAHISPEGNKMIAEYITPRIIDALNAQ